MKSNTYWRAQSTAKAVSIWKEAYSTGQYTLDLTDRAGAEQTIQKIKNYLYQLKARVKKNPLQFAELFQIIDACTISLPSPTILQVKRKHFVKGGYATFLTIPEPSQTIDHKAKVNLVMKNIRKNMIDTCNFEN